MPQYHYIVKEEAGDELSGVLEGESQSAVASELRGRGLYPISIEEFSKTTSVGTSHRFLRIRLKDTNIFFRQLANLTSAGMPILKALGVVKEQSVNPKMIAVIDDLHTAIHDGESFADALAGHPTIFPPMYSNLVRAGEAGGMLEDVLWRIVTFGEQDEELRGKAFSAMVYPAFLFVIGSTAVFILVSFVFPKFVAIFEDFDADLPWPTVLVMNVCGFMGQYWWAVLVAVLVMTWLGIVYKKSDTGRHQLDVLYLRVPLLNELLRRYEMAKFARTLGTLFDNGVPVLTALSITGDTLSNSVIRNEVRQVHDRVKDGDSISGALRYTEQFPPLVINMLAVGEEGGRLGEVTRRVAEAYDVEVERAVKALTTLLEPLMIVVMGIIIGFLVISMLLPMLTLSAQVR